MKIYRWYSFNFSNYSLLNALFQQVVFKYDTTNQYVPTLSLGIILRSLPNFKNTSPQVWSGLMPTPSIVRIEVVFSSTRNCISFLIPHRRRSEWRRRRAPHRERRWPWRVVRFLRWVWPWRWPYYPCSLSNNNINILWISIAT